MVRFFSTHTYPNGRCSHRAAPWWAGPPDAVGKGVQWPGSSRKASEALSPLLCPFDPALWLEEVRGFLVQSVTLPNSLGNLICRGIRGQRQEAFFKITFAFVTTWTVKGTKAWGRTNLPPLYQCHPWPPGPQTALNSGPTCPVMGQQANCGKKRAQLCPCGPRGRQSLRPAPAGSWTAARPRPSPHSQGQSSDLARAEKAPVDDPPSSSHRV